MYVIFALTLVFVCLLGDFIEQNSLVYQSLPVITKEIKLSTLIRLSLTYLNFANTVSLLLEFNFLLVEVVLG